MATFLGLPLVQYFDSNGDPLSGGKLHTYEVGTTTNKATYPTVADALAGTNANANPVILDSRGEATVVISGDTKLVLKDSNDVTIWTQDNVVEGGNVFDANGNELLEFTTVASAVNHIGIGNAATGNSPIIRAEGEADTGIIFDNEAGEEILILDSVASSVNELTIKSAATGNSPIIAATGEDDTGIKFENKAGEEILILDSIASSVNEFTVKSAATGANPELSATGDDANIGLDLQSKGTGTFNLLGTADQEARLTLAEDTSNGTNTVSINAPSSIASNRTVSLPDTDISTFLVQRVSTTSTTAASTTTTIPTDDTIPQNTEGDEYLTLSITPKHTSNILVIDFTGWISLSALNTLTVALFQDSTANALQAVPTAIEAVDRSRPVVLRHIMSAGTTSSTTFKIRYGPSAGTGYMLRNNAGESFSTADSATLMITEYSA